MEVLQYLGKLTDGHEVVMTSQEYTPYAIVTNYNPDTMSWASAYGYYSTLGALASDIKKLESEIAKQKVCEGLEELDKAWNKIEDNYMDLAEVDKNFEDAFAEKYPFKKSFGDIHPGFWVYSLKAYLNGYRKVGQTEVLEGVNNWGYPDGKEY